MNLTPAPSWLIERPIAHRALHDILDGRAENSMGAFKAAITSGYAIECDVQVCATGEPVVFHDPTLKRMTGRDGNVRDHTCQELEQFNLLDTSDGIYTLKKHLDEVNGQVPIVVELKGVEGEDVGFVEGVAKAIQGYEGPICVMSFDHWICAQFKTLMPDVPRGLTAHGDDETFDMHMQAMEDYDLQFVSYGIKNLPNRFVAKVREGGLPAISWTVCTEKQAAKSALYVDQITFEQYLPPLPVSDHSG